jgi:hypothetical protein
MYESFPGSSQENSKEQKKKEYLALAEKLSHNMEGFQFPGIDEQ